MIDLDHFKKINDTHGHIVGDDVLRSFANLMKAIMRSTDVAGRYGGEVFVVLLPETSLDGAGMFATRLNELAAALVHVDARSKTFQVTCSIGIAEYRDKDDDVSDILRRADTALYQAKESGRNRGILGPGSAIRCTMDR